MISLGFALKHKNKRKTSKILKRKKEGIEKGNLAKSFNCCIWVMDIWGKSLDHFLCFYVYL